MFHAQDAAHVIDEMADAFPLVAEHLPHRPAPATLADCVPLLAIASELLDRGPSSLTVEGVEAYRENTLRLLEYVLPVIEREANVSLGDWARQLMQPAPATAGMA